MSRSQPGLCTAVDIRSKNAQKFSLFLTFRSARRDPDVSGLDRQIASCQADPSDVGSSRASKTPCGAPNPKFSYRFRLIVQYLRPKPCNRVGCVELAMTHRGTRRYDARCVFATHPTWLPGYGRSRVTVCAALMPVNKRLLTVRPGQVGCAMLSRSRRRAPGRGRGGRSSDGWSGRTAACRLI
jgi:hypothetical protein